MKYSIYETEEIEKYSEQQLAKIDKGLVAAAYAIRDNARSMFENNGKYKGIGCLSEGIMLGRLIKNGGSTSITLHGYGYNDTKKQTYKTRFFILGTIERQGKKKDGSTYGKGYIQSLDSIQQAIDQGKGTLQQYLKKAIED